MKNTDHRLNGCCTDSSVNIRPIRVIRVLTGAQIREQVLVRDDYASALAPIAAESPVKRCEFGFVPDLERIAGYAEVARNEWLLLLKNLLLTISFNITTLLPPIYKNLSLKFKDR